jgi:hypothetical protein
MGEVDKVGKKEEIPSKKCIGMYRAELSKVQPWTSRRGHGD